MGEFNSAAPSLPPLWPTEQAHIESIPLEYDNGSEPIKCNQYVVKNKTHIIYGGYEGIPENLIVNFVGWICLLSLFTILRKKAWNYGRLALVQKYDNRKQTSRSKYNRVGNSEYNVWTQLFYGTDHEGNKSDSDSVASYDFNVHLDQGTFSWIPALFKIKDEHVLHKSGQDAVHYLSFQRHIILFMAIVTIVAIGVVLPLNFQGSLEGDNKEFGHTTISNLDPSSPYMWVHITLAFLFLPLGIAFTRHHSRLLHLSPSDLDPHSSHSEREALQSFVDRTVMITHVPRRSCHKDTLIKHFQEAYPEVQVCDLQFAYCIKDLIAYDKDRELANRAVIYCEEYERETGDRLLMRPYKCGVICCCCDIFGASKVDALEYYSNLEQCLITKVETEKVKALQRPTGVAFVTLDTVENAFKVLKDHKSVHCTCLVSPPHSSVSSELRPHNWIVKAAPAPSNIYWKNLSVTTRLWWAKAFMINSVLFIILFFMTTPAVVINSLDFVFFKEEWEQQMSPLLSEFLPTLLLWTIAALMPVLVAYSDQFMSHWTRSAENHSVMRKTFIFLLFMVVILPSLGLTSAKAFVEWIANPMANNGTYRWQCVFLPDNGAFFVNYIITSAFIGTSLELIRFPELFLYIIRLGLARSKAEIASVRRAILYEFQFGVQYAWMLLIFAMTIIYSLSCPIITPFGLLYMVFKHLVDKYNIYFAYGPSRISKNIHATAVNYVMVSIVLLQLCLLFFSLVRQGSLKARSIYSLVLLSITFLVFLCHVVLHWFKDLSPIEFKTFEDDAPSSESTSEGAPSGADGTSHSQGEGPCREESYFVPQVLRDGGVQGPRPSPSNVPDLPPDCSSREGEVTGPCEGDRLCPDTGGTKHYGTNGGAPDTHHKQAATEMSVPSPAVVPPTSTLMDGGASPSRFPPLPGGRMAVTGLGPNSILDTFSGESDSPMGALPTKV